MKAALFVTFLIAGVALSLLLGGCESAHTLRGSGQPAAAPIGYLIACNKIPRPESCPPP